MSSLQELLKKISKGIEPYKGRRRHYQMTTEELFLMGEYAKEAPLECVVTMFDYGFFKGVSYQKNKSKKLSNSSAERGE